jgi:hypothetical protein
VASEKLGIDIWPLEELAAQEKSHFDVITLWHVLEHVHDIGGYLDHFRSILKSDGVLMIAVPNYTSTDAAIYGSKWAAYDTPRHLWHFSPLAMEKLLSLHGFTLRQKRRMPLDAFYVSMLSEKYRANYTWGPVSAFFNGLRSYFSSRKYIDKASSILYTAKL